MNEKAFIIFDRFFSCSFRWIRELETRRHIRETLHDFPACRPLKSSPEMIHALTRHSSHAANLPDYVTLTNGVELTVSSVSSLERRRGQHRNAVEKFHQQILSERYGKHFIFLSL